jgi:ureidoacrylate peracid hydrolase
MPLENKMEPEMLTAPADILDSRHTALIIIDMQKDFCTPGFGADQAGRDLRPTRAIIPALETLLASARAAGVLVVHVGFWTLPDHLSDSGPWLAQRRRATFSSDKLALAGAEGAHFIDELSPRAGEPVVHKHRYSAFKGTDLGMILNTRRIRSTVITGVSTNACVESTLRDAFETGYYVAIPRDGTASWSRELYEATLANVTHRFGLVTDIAAITEIWQSTGDRS